MPTAAAQKAYLGRLFDRAAASYDRVGNALFAPAGAAFTGIDLAAAMVSATAADITRRGAANASVRVGDAESPEFPDRSFDAVLAGFVVFFLPHLSAALRAYARLLRPAGRLALSTFAEPSDQEIAFAQTCGAAVAPYLPPLPTWDDPPPLQRLRTTESVTGAVQAAGFVDVRSDQRDFEGPVQCWHWLWSGGLRGMLEQVPPDRRDAARAAFIRAVGQLSGPADSVAMTGRVRITTARLPS